MPSSATTTSAEWRTAMVQWIRSPTRTVSGVTATVIAETAPSAASGYADTVTIGNAVNSKKRSRLSNPDATLSNLAFTIPEKGVQITDKGSVGIEKNGINAHAPESLPKFFMLPGLFLPITGNFMAAACIHCYP